MSLTRTTQKKKNQTIRLLLQFLTFNFFSGPSQAKYEKLQTGVIDMSSYRLHCQSLLQKMEENLEDD
jgi:hypothetical protein